MLHRYEGDEGDYGVNSYQINIPKELGGSLEKVRAIDIVLCAYAPCREQMRNVAQSVVPLPDDPATPVVEPQPFFVNPTSCETDKVRLEARSYSPPGELQSLEVTGATGGTYTLTFGGQTTAPIPFNAVDTAVESALQALSSIGTGNVVVTREGPPGIYRARFAGALRGVNVEQLTASEAGLTPSGTVTIATTHTGGKDESFEDFLETDLPVTGCENVPFDPTVSVTPDDPAPGVSSPQTVSIDYPDYAEDPIWQAAVKDADITLPEGMQLADDSGWNRGSCTYAQFGLDPATGKQLNDDPVRCPDQAEVANLTVSSPASPVPLSGTVYLGPRGSAGEPTSDAPWPLFALVQGAGLRIKFAASLYYDPQGAIRLQLQGLPELPFQHVRLTTVAGFLRNPATCGIHEGTAELVGYNGATKTSHPSLTVSACSGALSGGGAFAPVTDRSQASLCQIGGRSSCPVGPASHGGTPHPEGISLAGSEITYVAGLGQTNVVTVVRNPTTYTITDSGIATFPDGDGAGGCTVAGQTATCPRAGVTLVVIEVLDGNDTVDGGPENDYILGGDGGDALDGFEGDDTIDTGLGDPLFEFFDTANGGTGFNTITFASRPAGGSGVMIDNRPDRDFAIDTDGSSETMDAMQVLVGTPNDDEMIGAYTSEVLVGGPGADTLCGGLGNDTVDYSSSTLPVRVTLDGDMPTDPDLGIQLLPDHSGESGEALRQRFFKARHDCRQTNPADRASGHAGGPGLHRRRRAVQPRHRGLHRQRLRG